MPSSVRRGIPYPWGWIVLAGVVVVILVLTVSGGSRVPGGPGQRTNASGTPSPSTSPRSLESPPRCRFGDLPALHTGYGDWPRTLLDRTFALPSTYAPPGLVPITSAGFPEPLLVRSFVVPDLTALREAADQSGNPIDVVAAYRSYAQQKALLHRRISQFGRTVGLTKTARPGHSEHQLGTTLDFKTEGARGVSDRWESTPVGLWMARNAYRYGFVMSYPQDKEGVTCYSYEPWHYRYLGRGLAADVHSSGLTTREYLWAHFVHPSVEA